MRVRAGLALPVLACLSCRPPQAVVAAPGLKPLRVNVWIHPALPGREELEGRLSETLRDTLSDRARILAKGAGPADGEAHLEVHVTAAKERGDLVKENAEVAFLTPVLVLAQPSGDPRAFVFLVALGAAAGTVAAPVAAVGTEARGVYHNLRLGFKPRHLVCKVTYRPEPGGTAVPLFSLGAWEVVKAMRPLADGRPKDWEAVREEEAKALARVVSDRLSRDFHWAPLPR